MTALSIADVLDAYELARRDIVIAAERTSRASRRLSQHIGGVDAADREAVAVAVETFGAARRATGVADGTIRRELIVLRAAMRHAWKQGRLLDCPYVGLPPAGAGRQRWLTRQEARSLLHHIDQPAYLFVRLALATGARAGAILELTWDRVDLVGGTVDFRAPHPKAHRRKRRAIVPLTDTLLVELANAKRRAQAAPTDRVVPSSLRTIARYLRSAAAAADIAHVSPHALRHTAATWMLAGGIPLVDTSRLLGHASTLITEQVYAHLIVSALRPAARLLEDWMQDAVADDAARC